MCSSLKIFEDLALHINGMGGKKRCSEYDSDSINERLKKNKKEEVGTGFEQ